MSKKIITVNKPRGWFESGTAVAMWGAGLQLRMGDRLSAGPMRAGRFNYILSSTLIPRSERPLFITIEKLSQRASL